MASGLGDLAATLRGGTQPANQLLTQLASRPGVQKGALSRVFGHIDPAQKMSPLELSAQARSPKLYAQRSMTGTGATNEDAIMEYATDALWSAQFAPQRRQVLVGMLDEMSKHPDVDKRLRDEAAQLLRAKNTTMAWERGAETLAEKHPEYAPQDAYMEDLLPQVEQWVRENSPELSTGKVLGPAFQQYQRQKNLWRSIDEDSEVPGSGYFETVLRGAPSLGQRGSEGGVNAGVMQPDPSFHFTNPAQLGHVRGTVGQQGRVFAEEMQSDPLEIANAAQMPELSGVYGKLGRMLLDRSAEAGAPSVSFPSAERIAAVRSKQQLPFFKSVYDKDLDKQLYRPLQAKGVPLVQDWGWTTVELPPDLVEAIKGGKLLDYKQGGTVAPQQPWWRSAKGGLSKATK